MYILCTYNVYCMYCRKIMHTLRDWLYGMVVGWTRRVDIVSSWVLGSFDNTENDSRIFIIHDKFRVAMLHFDIDYWRRICRIFLTFAKEETGKFRTSLIGIQKRTGRWGRCRCHFRSKLFNGTFTTMQCNKRIQQWVYVTNTL